MGALVTSHAFMYCAEGGLRATVKPSRLLLVHHALFFVLMASSLWTGPSLLMVKVGLHSTHGPATPPSACAADL
jgi:hypothetical protein